jgi:hypothetical protein
MTNKNKDITYFSLFLQVLFGCICPDLCIAYSFGFFFFGSLHADHEDLINKHVMMIRVTDNILSVKDGDIIYHTTAGRLIRRSIIHTR